MNFEERKKTKNQQQQKPRNQPTRSVATIRERRHGLGMGRTRGTRRCATSHNRWWFIIAGGTGGKRGGKVKVIKKSQKSEIVELFPRPVKSSQIPPDAGTWTISGTVR